MLCPGPIKCMSSLSILINKLKYFNVTRLLLFTPISLTNIIRIPAVTCLPRKCVEEPSSLCLWKGHPHSGHESRMKNDSTNLVTGSQINSWYRTDTLSVENYIFRWNTVLGAKGVPSPLDVRVEVFLWGLARTGAVAGVIVTEDVTVDSAKKI